MTEILEPIEVEVEKYTEDDYEEVLRDLYGDVLVCGMTMDAAWVLKECDPIAFRCDFADYQEYETKYECPICREQFDDEFDAKWHCQEELEDEEDK